jgi:hypothetical protein
MTALPSGCAFTGWQHGPQDRADRLSAVRDLLPVPDAGADRRSFLADKVTDIQRINTAIMRLASTQYLSRNLAPRMYVPDELRDRNTL